MSRSLKCLEKEHVIVIYEGSSEKAIYDLLYSNDYLIYKKDSELIRKSTGTRQAKKFAYENLRQDYEGIPVNIVRILDSDKENFNLGKEYSERIDSGEIKIHNIVTSPEIEILVILNEQKYDEFKKAKYKNKAAEFCKSYLKYNKIKSYDFIKTYFSSNDLLITIKKYNEITKNNNLNLYDLLDDDIKSDLDIN